jgi:PIN domain nuclease of toxin-antitoxin system
LILLDTNAVIWALTGDARAAALFASGRRLRLSPVCLLEIRFLVEVGRLRLVRGRSVGEVVDDPRWQLDSPSSARLFTVALDVEWTRDPFDRLLVAHARYRRWRLATGDRFLIEQLQEEEVLPL